MSKSGIPWMYWWYRPFNPLKLEHHFILWKTVVFVRNYMQILYTCSPGWLRHRNRGSEVWAIADNLSVYFHDVQIRLPKRGDTGLHMDCMYMRWDDVCMVTVVPEQLMSRRMKAQLGLCWNRESWREFCSLLTSLLVFIDVSLMCGYMMGVVNNGSLQRISSAHLAPSWCPGSTYTRTSIFISYKCSGQIFRE